MSEIEPDVRRQFLERRFKTPPTLTTIAQAPDTVVDPDLQAAAFVGFYGDPRSFEAIRFQPFGERARVHKDLRCARARSAPTEKVDQSEDIGVEEIEYDVFIIGSGAGGAILAYELAKQHRLEVLVLERGRYVGAAELRRGSGRDDRQLYADGIMQQTEDLSFTVLQGSCWAGPRRSTTPSASVPRRAVLALERRGARRGARPRPG